MEKVYRILDWLELEQAVSWLQDLTGTLVTSSELLQLCESKQCEAYADVDYVASDEPGFDKGVAKGVHLVINPLQAFGGGVGWNDREIFTTGDTYTQIGATLLFKGLPRWKRAPLFQPSAIQALADKMNATTNQPTAAEIEGLREQLKKACEAKDNAWHLTNKYKTEVETLREIVEQNEAAREAACFRAGQAEDQLNELEQRLEHMTERANSCFSAYESQKALAAELGNELGQEQMARKYAENLARELRDELEEEYQARVSESRSNAEGFSDSRQPDDAKSLSVGGVIFPYATKQLQAMRDAALTHWANHDRSKPAPYGMQKTVMSFMAPLVGENARKLTELAAAIKPDGLPKA